ncbi:MAG: 3-hydroxyacyl-CoA dehydrogenase family protein [Thermodesulfobacteriota bacterium]
MTVPEKLERVAVVGCGLMGHGIAQVFAAAGRPVTLIGRREESLATALERIEASLAEFERHALLKASDREAARARIITSTDIKKASEAQLVIEAVPFQRELQREIFSQLDEVCAPPAVIASTSGEIISRIYDRMRRPERAVAAHFWYPAQLIPIVEICGGPKTDPEVVTWLRNVIETIGKVPAVVEREVDGFIGNRIQFAMLREAWSMWANGIASAQDIDAVVRNTLGRRLSVTGPIESAEVGGLDTLHAFGAFLFPSLETSSDPPAKVTALVEAGCRGLPNGRGIYDWSRRDGKGLVAARVAMLFRHLRFDQERKSE